MVLTPYTTTTTTPPQVKEYAGPHGHEVLDVAIAADNASFASGGGDRTVFLWDVASGQVCG